MRLIPRLGEAARRVLVELRRGPMTVEELARSLRLTDNAVRNQLRKLQSANFITPSGKKPGPSKPSTFYSITLEGQIQFSTLYLPILTSFLHVAEGRCTGAQLGTLMTEAGTSFAARYPRAQGTLKDRAHAGAKLLTSFGAITRIQTNNGPLRIRSVGCPLGALTSETPVACKVLKGLLDEYMTASVKICCEREPEPRCCFEVRT